MMSTQMPLFNGQSGQPFSYRYNGDMNSDGTPNDLIYVPKDISDINLVQTTIKNADGTDKILTPQDQWDMLDAFIEGDDYLKTRRGKYAEEMVRGCRSTSTCRTISAKATKPGTSRSRGTWPKPEGDVRWRRLLTRALGARSLILCGLILLGSAAELHAGTLLSPGAGVLGAQIRRAVRRIRLRYLLRQPPAEMARSEGQARRRHGAARAVRRRPGQLRLACGAQAARHRRPGPRPRRPRAARRDQPRHQPFDQGRR